MPEKIANWRQILFIRAYCQKTIAAFDTVRKAQ